MLEKIKILGFRVHKNIEIELDKRITVLTGVNDAGKTTVISALEWLACNKPNGSDFINWYKKNAHVIVYVDGQKIKRSKGTENLYWLNKNKYQAFGSKVPEPIQKLLNISDATWSRQHDSIFQLSESPGQVSKALNKIINLEIIDKSLSKISHEVRKSKSRLEICKERLRDAKQKEKGLSWVIDFAAEVEKLKQRQDNLEALRKKHLTAEKLVAKAIKAKAKVRTLLKQNQYDTKTIDKIRSKITEYKAIRRKNQELEQSIWKIEKMQRLIENREKNISSQMLVLDELKSQWKRCPVCKTPM